LSPICAPLIDRGPECANPIRPGRGLLNVVWFRPEAPKGAARILDELHLREVRRQRVGSRVDGPDRGVARLLGGFSRFLGRLAKRLPLVADRLHVLAQPLAQLPRFLSQRAILFRVAPFRFSEHALLLGGTALAVRLLAKVLSRLASLFRLDARRFRVVPVVGHGWASWRS
jgi:hypothetical protein